MVPIGSTRYHTSITREFIAKDARRNRERVADHRYRRQAHGQRSDHRTQQQSERRVEQSGGDRHTQRVVQERKPRFCFMFPTVALEI